MPVLAEWVFDIDEGFCGRSEEDVGFLTAEMVAIAFVSLLVSCVVLKWGEMPTRASGLEPSGAPASAVSACCLMTFLVSDKLPVGMFWLSKYLWTEKVVPKQGPRRSSWDRCSHRTSSASPKYKEGEGGHGVFVLVLEIDHH